MMLLQMVFAGVLLGQNSSENESTEQIESKNLLGLFLGNTVVYQTNIHLPTVGVEYVRELNYRWGIGAIAEVEIGYEVLDDKTSSAPATLYERKTAVLFQPAVFCRIYKGLIASFGYGLEFENTEHETELGLFKLGLEYRLCMKNPKWYVLPSLSWDHTSRYDGVVYGVLFAYKF